MEKKWDQFHLSNFRESDYEFSYALNVKRIFALNLDFSIQLVLLLKPIFAYWEIDLDLFKIKFA